MTGQNERQIGLRQVEGNLDRLNLRDGHERRGAVGRDHVAGMDQQRAGLAVHRRANLRIAEIQLRDVDGSLVGGERCVKDLYVARGRIALLSRYGADLIQMLIERHVTIGIFQLGLIAGQQGTCLSKRSLKGPGVDAKKQIAFLDELAFLEVCRVQHALNARGDLDSRVGDDRARSPPDHRHVATHDVCDVRYQNAPRARISAPPPTNHLRDLRGFAFRVTPGMFSTICLEGGTFMFAIAARRKPARVSTTIALTKLTARVPGLK